MYTDDRPVGITLETNTEQNTTNLSLNYSSHYSLDLVLHSFVLQFIIYAFQHIPEAVIQKNVSKYTNT